MFIKRHITFIVILFLIALIAAAFFVWLDWHEKNITRQYLQEQKEITDALHARLEQIRQQKMEEEKEFSDTESFLRQYLIRKETYNGAKKEIEERLNEDIATVSELVLLTEERIEISTQLRQYLMDQTDVSNHIHSFILKEISFLDKDIEAYTLILQYYSLFDASYILNEEMMSNINDLLAQSIVLEAQASQLLEEVLKEYGLVSLME
jgi:hypothetical protein